jgi:hypothetical protein
MQLLHNIRSGMYGRRNSLSYVLIHTWIENCILSLRSYYAHASSANMAGDDLYLYIANKKKCPLHILITQATKITSRKRIL